MLIKFKISNFKSFKELNEFSMVKGKQRFYEDRISHCNKINILKFSSIFGPNASGKSNLIRAIKVMQFIVLNNRVPIDAYNEYYKLEEECAKKPTYFEMIFSIGDQIYSYGFEIYLNNIKNIESEWLYKLYKKSDGTIDETKIFEKKDGLITFKEKNVSQRLQIYKEDIKFNPAKLYLSHVAFNKLVFIGNKDDVASTIIKIYDWFQSSLRVLYTGEPLYSPELTNNINEEKIGKLLSYFDTGIKSIFLEKCDQRDFFKDILPGSVDLVLLQNTLELQSRIKGSENASTIIRTPRDIWIIGIENKSLVYKRLCFYHNDKPSPMFRVSNESDGTLRLFELAETIINNDRNKVVIVDELDRCLHPMLTVQYVKLFLNKVSRNDDLSQLIVTTHESRLLDLDILRRDEIWFVKKENGKSNLYSLEEFNVRFDRIIDKAYLDGRYGGVPIFDSLYFPEYVIHENTKYKI